MKIFLFILKMPFLCKKEMKRYSFLLLFLLFAFYHSDAQSWGWGISSGIFGTTQFFNEESADDNFVNLSYSINLDVFKELSSQTSLKGGLRLSAIGIEQSDENIRFGTCRFTPVVVVIDNPTSGGFSLGRPAGRDYIHTNFTAFQIGFPLDFRFKFNQDGNWFGFVGEEIGLFIAPQSFQSTLVCYDGLEGDSHPLDNYSHQLNDLIVNLNTGLGYEILTFSSGQQLYAEFRLEYNLASTLLDDGLIEEGFSMFPRPVPFNFIANSNLFKAGLNFGLKF